MKRYERDADKLLTNPEGILRLIGVDVDLVNSPVLYSKVFTDEVIKEDFDIRSGEWYVEDGWLVGKNPGSFPGMILHNDDFFGNVMLDFKAKMIEPSTHDINVMINGSWNYETNQRDIAYVVGFEGFWHGNVGFEKSPTYNMYVATSLLEFDPGKTYHFQVGNIDGHIFAVVDGKIALEILDPEPIDTSKYAKVGFEAFSSWWKVTDFSVKRIEYKKVKERYIPEF